MQIGVLNCEKLSKFWLFGVTPFAHDALEVTGSAIAARKLVASW